MLYLKILFWLVFSFVIASGELRIIPIGSVDAFEDYDYVIADVDLNDLSLDRNREVIVSSFLYPFLKGYDSTLSDSQVISAAMGHRVPITKSIINSFDGWKPIKIIATDSALFNKGYVEKVTRSVPYNSIELIIIIIGGVLCALLGAIIRKRYWQIAYWNAKNKISFLVAIMYVPAFLYGAIVINLATNIEPIFEPEFMDKWSFLLFFTFLFGALCLIVIIFIYCFLANGKFPEGTISEKEKKFDLLFISNVMTIAVLANCFLFFWFYSGSLPSPTALKSLVWSVGIAVMYLVLSDLCFGKLIPEANKESFKDNKNLQ